MSAMPHAHQMEEVLENLAAGKTTQPSKKLELQPQWRLVSRDGSTSSVNGVPERKKLECPDCLAGRCGQNPQGCQCTGGGDKQTISLDHLTEASQAAVDLNATGGGSSPSMPQAKPQLFDEPAQETTSTRVDDWSLWGQGPSIAGDVPAKSVRTSDSASGVNQEDAKDDPLEGSPISRPPIEELQKVIDLWPQLPLSTRRAILALVGSLNEADSA